MIKQRNFMFSGAINIRPGTHCTHNFLIRIKDPVSVNVHSHITHKQIILTKLRKNPEDDRK